MHRKYNSGEGPMAKENLDLLELDDEDGVLPDLPENDPFCARPRRPWLLFALGALVIVLATYIIISVINHGAEDSVDISLDLPVVEQVAPDGDGADKLTIGGKQGASGTDSAVSGAPTRVIDDRTDVQFNPNAPVVEPPRPRPATKPAAEKPRPVSTTTPGSAPRASSSGGGGWQVQFASLTTRSAAEASAARIKSQHPGIFEGRQFLILGAQLDNGATTYRVRIGGFASAGDANGFCRNAKSDGLDCYVVRN